MVPRLAVLALILVSLAPGCRPAGTPDGSAAGPCRAVTIAHHAVTLAAADSPTPEFKLDSGTQPVGLVLDRDGASVWLLGDGANTVLHVMPDGSAVRYDLPASALGLQLAQAPDGTVWVPEQYRGAVMAIAAGGRATECFLPDRHSQPQATAVATDGSVWVGEAKGAGGGRIGRLANSRWAEYPAGAAVAEVLASPDGGAWFTVEGASFLGHVTPAGSVTRIPLGGSSTPLGMLAASDGSIWVADFGGDALIRVSADGSLTRWSTSAGAKPQSFARAPDGTIWFTESGIDRLGRVSGTKVVEAYRTGGWPDHIVITADGWAWFTEYYEDAVGRVSRTALAEAG